MHTEKMKDYLLHQNLPPTPCKYFSLLLPHISYSPISLTVFPRHLRCSADSFLYR